MHSTASDGELAPARLVALAQAQGVRVMALTDHDSVAGLAEARQAGNELGVDVINGVEISSRWDVHDIHVVGLGVDPGNGALQTRLASQMDRRQQRAAQIAQRLIKLGLPDVLAPASEGAPQGIPARPHFARALVAAGACRQEKDAFAKYLAQGKPAYVKTQWPSIAEAAAWIRESGGVPVLAHPHRYKMTRTKLDRLIRQFAESGGQAVEVVTANQDNGTAQQLSGFCNTYGLYASLGSDYHGPAMRWIQPGRMPKLPSQCRPVWSLLGIEEPQS